MNIRKYGSYKDRAKVPGGRQQRLIRLIAAILIVRENEIQHPNALNGCLEVVRAGYMDEYKVRVV